MNSKERFKIALNSKKPDVVPTGSFFNCDYKAKLINTHPYEFLFGGSEIKLNAIFALADRHKEDWIQCDPSLSKRWLNQHKIVYGKENGDAWIVNKKTDEHFKIAIDMTCNSSKWNSQFVPGSSMGFSFSEMAVPASEIKTPDDVNDKIKVLSCNEIIEDERFITIKNIYEKYRNEKYLMFWSGNLLFNTLYFFENLDEGLIATIVAKELFNALLDLNLKQELESAKAGKMLGGDGVWMAEMLASNDVISPAFYEENILPRQKQFVEGVHNLGLDIFIYQTGNVIGSIPAIKELGVDAIVIENNDKKNGMIDIAEVREAAGNEIALFGNIDPIYNLEKGSTDDVEQEVLRQFDAAGKNGGFIVHSNIIPVTAKPENIDTMIQTAKEKCVYN